MLLCLCWRIFSFNWPRSVGNFVLSDSVYFSSVEWLISILISFVVVCSIQLLANVTFKVRLFDYFPSISEALNSS